MNVEHPNDVRNNTSQPPCDICGQPEQGHPNTAGFHRYTRADAVGLADRQVPAPEAGDAAAAADGTKSSS